LTEHLAMIAQSELPMNSKQFVNVNLALGALTAAANGGAAVMMLGDPSRWAAAEIGEAVLFASIGFALVVVGASAIAGRTSLSRALSWQAGSLAGLLCLLTLWGLTVLLGNSDQQIATSWMVGVLSGLAVYLFYLVRHAADPRRFAALRPILLGLCAVAIAVDVGVFARVGWF
jgi:hypothetical protein